MNIISRNISSMIWIVIVLAMGLLYACPDVDSGGDSTPTLQAEDIIYYTSIAYGTAGTIKPQSSGTSDFSDLIFSIAPISSYVGDGVQKPTIAKDGTITTTTATSAGLYRVTITPDGSTILSNPIAVEFYVTVKPENIGALDTVLRQGIMDYGLESDFNYIDTSEVTDMSHLFRSGYTPGTGVEDAERTYVQDFNGDISKWDVSSVENFNYMFYRATGFNQDLSSWSVDSTDSTVDIFKYSRVSPLPAWYVYTLQAEDIIYDNDRVVQGTASTTIPSSAISDFSGLTFSIAPIGSYVGDGVQEPTIAEDGTITTTTTTSAGSYRVTITPDGNILKGDPITVDFYVTVKPADIGALDTVLRQGIMDYGLESDFNYYIDTSEVTDMSWLFASGYTPGTGVENAERTYVQDFNGDISKWDVSAVEDFSNMFVGATAFNQDISGWEVSAGTDFSWMFNGATAFNQDLSSWSVDTTDSTVGIFKNSGVSPLPDWYSHTLQEGDIQYDITKIAQGTAGTVTPSSSILTILFSDLTFSIAPISSYVGTRIHAKPTITANGAITTTTSTSAGSYRVTITPDGNILKGRPITVDFYVTVKPADIAALDTTLQTAITNYGLTGDFNYIDTSAVTNMSYLFRSGYTPGTGTWDAARTYVKGFKGDISKWDVSAVKDFSNMFYGAYTFNQDIGEWKVSAGKDFSAMFYRAYAFNQNIDEWDVSAGENFSEMFWGATSFNQDIGEWKVSAGTDFSRMFYRAASFNQDIGDWDVSAGKYFYGMFREATTFNQDIGRWKEKVSAGENFRGMFYGATSFNQNIGGWDVSAGKDFMEMFQSATAFNNGGSPDIGNWNVSTGTSFRYMFYRATAFNQDLSRWKVSSTAGTTNMFRDSGVTTPPSWYQ